MMDEDAAELAKLDPAILNNRRNSVCDEGVVLDGQDTPAKVYPKSEKLKQLLKNAAKSVFIFTHLNDVELSKIIDSMFLKKVVKGERIITQGYDGELFYIVESGNFENLHIQPNGKKTFIHNFGPGSCFGEIALMHTIQRPSTVRATSDGVLWQLQRSAFKEIVLREAYKRRQSYEAIMNAVPEFHQLDDDDKLRVTDSIEIKYFQDGDAIMVNGEYPDGIYFALPEGAMVKVYEKPGIESFVELRIGDIFGENSILKDSKNTNTIYSSGPAALAFLRRSAIEPLLSECADLLKQSSKIKQKLQASGAQSILI